MRHPEKKLRSITNCTPNPSDYEIGSLQSRAAARALLIESRKRFRLIIHTTGQPLNLETSNCERSWWPDGTLFEYVMLDGGRKHITDDGLDKFVSRFPIVERGERNRP